MATLPGSGEILNVAPPTMFVVKTFNGMLKHPALYVLPSAPAFKVPTLNAAGITTKMPANALSLFATQPLLKLANNPNARMYSVATKFHQVWTREAPQHQFWT